MENPLTREQESLRSRRVEDMTEAELSLWINACDKMVIWVRPAKARQTWRAGRKRAELEIAKQEARSRRRRAHLG